MYGPPNVYKTIILIPENVCTRVIPDQDGGYCILTTGGASVSRSLSNREVASIAPLDV